MQRKKWRKLFEGNHKFVIFLSQKEIPVKRRKSPSQKQYFNNSQTAGAPREYFCGIFSCLKDQTSQPGVRKPGIYLLEIT